MFTSQHFSLTESELRSVASDFGDEKSAIVAVRSAMARAKAKIMVDILSAETARVDLLRGAALILHDMEHILDSQISAELARRRSPAGTTDRRFEV